MGLLDKQSYYGPLAGKLPASGENCHRFSFAYASCTFSIAWVQLCGTDIPVVSDHSSCAAFVIYNIDHY